MNASELKYHVEQTDSLFFTRENMKFFGDTMKNYGVRSAVIDTYSEEGVDVWELYRKNPVKHGNKSSAFFNKEDYSREHEKK